MTAIKYPLALPYIDDKDKSAVLSVLDSGMLSLGPKLTEFEQKFAQYLGATYATAVSSGTAGLHLAVKSLGLTHGDEVITTPISFVASANCLLYEGVKPVFIDIEEQTYNLDPTVLEAAITPRTKAILVVHIFGQPATLDAVTALARKHKLYIIEDACESLGARYRGKFTGTLGDIGVFAFYPNKQITTGEGGMIVTNSKRLNTICGELRNQGRQLGDQWLIHKQMGYNFRLDEMSAALGISQLKKIDWLLSQRRKIAELYTLYLADAPAIRLPQIGPSRTHTWFVYVIRVLNKKRDYLMQELLKMGIQTRPYVPPIHLQPYFQKQFGYKPGAYPLAERVASETLALPLYIGLTQKDIAYISNQIKEVLASAT